MSDERQRAVGEELRLVHQTLRAALAVAVESIENDEPVRGLRELPLYCWGFCAALGGHHRSEDRVLFPQVLGNRPDLAPTIARLSQDHLLIDQLIRDLERALVNGAPRTDTLRHIDGIAAVMESHFRYEERQLVDVLDAVDDMRLDRRELFGPIP